MGIGGRESRRVRDNLRLSAASSAAQHAGLYTWPWNQATYPKVQIMTVAELLAGGLPPLRF